MSIKHWPCMERPREKLLAQGAASLSNAELLAILLRTGTQGLSAVDLARDLLSRFGGLNAIFAAPQWELCEQKGIGNAAFLQLQVVSQLAQRQLKEQILQKAALGNSQLVSDYLRLHLSSLKHECLVLIYLNCQHQVIDMAEVASGGLQSQSVSMRLLAEAALKQQAAAIILVHNHPSGLLCFSDADITFTDHVRQALRPLDIDVLDHFLVAGNSILSMLAMKQQYSA